MQPPLGERFAMLNFQQKDLARLAQVDPKTISDLLRGRRRRGGHPHVMKEIERAMSEHEKRVRDYLISIHGVPQGQ